MFNSFFSAVLSALRFVGAKLLIALCFITDERFMLLYAGWIVSDVLRMLSLNARALLESWHAGLMLIVLVAVQCFIVVRVWRRIGRQMRYGKERALGVVAECLEKHKP